MLQYWLLLFKIDTIEVQFTKWKNDIVQWYTTWDKLLQYKKILFIIVQY